MKRFLVSLSVVSLMALYFIASDLKYQTQDARKQLREVEIAIGYEKETLKVLGAEWSHLTRPENLRQLSQAHLGLNNVRVEQFASIEDVPYLGMDYFDRDEDTPALQYASTPREKPSLYAMAPARRGFATPIQIAQVEMVDIGRQRAR
jgi:hypothetical protein